MTRLGIDFGTSNSAVAVATQGEVRRIPIERGAETLPTAVFFPEDGSDMRIGRSAADALIEGEDGRYMRALKSVLGTPLFHEKRLIAGRRRTLADVVTAFLRSAKSRAEATAEVRFDRVLSGRPVHFHSADPGRDAQAEADLRACYAAAGFADVAFMFEPEAAAIASRGDADETGLVVDIGGGTSDFTLFRRRAGGVEVLGSHGIRLGGTDFDRTLSLAFAMPELGMNGELVRTLGEGRLPVPRQIYADLATWPMIPFLYTRETGREVEDLVRHAVDRTRLSRLKTVIRDHLGHDLAFAVERAKIAANRQERDAAIDMSLIEPGLRVPMPASAMTGVLGDFREPLRLALYQTLMQAGATPGAVDHVVLVGGSSLMRLVSEVAVEVCPQARISRAEAFTAVVDGLALAAQ
ncbi:Molecular chaperone, DnaK [Pseudooceanicola batsensis HTCC2597]|uniref:Molecular chaperone, DnaK n=1 Tax=Pseudooceanicola batsensis (strain ATCC BAA-863 / DSM 15984 / KCTC 12145 / HTCC2597) TaxID=252305 RepID=A3TV79_PSEBH|nr:Hsp70 family protein [Pseudooceanicola batsensis]EAQ04425.1 Molecular chaperone, DnaK [Pseudooceanicola batsensis HTCC2597]